MNNILDRFVSPSVAFQPKTVQELFALRLAQKLQDVRAVMHYVALVDSYSEGHLLYAYRRVKPLEVRTDLGRDFHQELLRATGNSFSISDSNQISIRIERRTVAAAIFRGSHLEYSDSRQLSSAHDKASASAVAFIDWLLRRFPVEFATLESIPNGHEIQRQVLHAAICKTLRERALSIWEVSRDELLSGYGYPRLKSRSQLRSVATAIWPILAGTRAKVFVQDAAILGLHVQTERLFIIN